MEIKSRVRGHEIEYNPEEARWYFTETGIPLGNPNQVPCKKCGKLPTPDGHDACLGALRDVSHACCGHGHPEDSYVIRRDGTDMSLEEYREIEDSLPEDPPSAEELLAYALDTLVGSHGLHSQTCLCDQEPYIDMLSCPYCQAREFLEKYQGERSGR